jgi:hypothetical protein
VGIGLGAFRQEPPPLLVNVFPMGGRAAQLDWRNASPRAGGKGRPDAATGAIVPMFPNNAGEPTMTSPNATRWMLLVAANALVMGVLGFYSTSGAAPQSGQPPFNNSVEQRESQLRELREIKELLKEQNALLKAGASKLHAANPR